MDEVDLSAKLDLEALVNENKCYCKVVSKLCLA